MQAPRHWPRFWIAPLSPVHSSTPTQPMFLNSKSSDIFKTISSLDSAKFRQDRSKTVLLVTGRNSIEGAEQNIVQARRSQVPAEASSSFLNQGQERWGCPEVMAFLSPCCWSCGVWHESMEPPFHALTEAVHASLRRWLVLMNVPPLHPAILSPRSATSTAIPQSARLSARVMSLS